MDRFTMLEGLNPVPEPRGNPTAPASVEVRRLRRIDPATPPRRRRGGLAALAACAICLAVVAIMATAERGPVSSEIDVAMPSTSIQPGAQGGDEASVGGLAPALSVINDADHLGETIARLQIEAIDLDEAVLEGVGNDVLRAGIGHYPATPLPGHAGNAALAGHRRSFGAPFEQLDRLGSGDRIVATTVQGRFEYVVEEIRVVDPADVSVLDSGEDNLLTITTTHPAFNSRQRLVVIARLDGDPAPVSSVQQMIDETLALDVDAVPSEPVSALRWTALDPVDGEASPGVFWTGAEVLTVNSTNGGNDVEVVRWAPGETRTRLAETSEMSWRANPAMAWTGAELLVVGGSSGPALEPFAKAYDPATDTWRRLPDPPVEVDGWENAIGSGFWTGTELVMAGTGLAFDPASDAWRVLESLPLADRSRPVTAWTGTELLVWGGCDPAAGVGGQCDERNEALLGSGLRYDIQSGEAQPLPPAPLPPAVHAVAAWTGTELVVVVTDPPNGGGMVAAAFSPRRNAWRELAAPPLEVRRHAAAVWTGNRVVLWGGAGGSAGGALSDGAVFDPLSDDWTVVQAPADQARTLHSMVPAQDSIFVSATRVASSPLLLDLVSGGDSFLPARAPVGDRVVYPITLLDGRRVDLTLAAETAFDPRTLERSASLDGLVTVTSCGDETCPGDATRDAGPWTVTAADDPAQRAFDGVGYSYRRDGTLVLRSHRLGPIDAPDAVLIDEERRVAVLERDCARAGEQNAAGLHVIEVSDAQPWSWQLCDPERGLEVWLSAGFDVDDMNAVAIEG